MAKTRRKLTNPFTALKEWDNCWVCDNCDPYSEDKKHPPEFAIDGAETWWQSPPLSRGMSYNEVNLTIDLGQVDLRNLVEA
ncbi:Putative laminin A chain [Gryllus bimaculatus]|nr:Putative laminin A chain [Gryllus bimaculatus]